MQITVDMLEDLAAGAAFLATGGGGDSYIACLSARRALQIYGPATLLAPDDLNPDATVVALGGVGAPTTSLELLPSINDGIKVLDAYRALTGRSVDAIVSFEIGGGNSLFPIVAAAASGLPVIDGDGMGRALPEAQMMTYAIAGHAATPAVVLDYKGDAELVECDDVLTYERAVRKFAMDRGGMVTSAEFAMTGRELQQCVVPGTVSLSIAIGKILRAGLGNADQVAVRLDSLFASSIYGELRNLYSGIVSDMTTSVVGGFDVGRAVIESLDPGTPALTIDIKNEYLVARIGARIVASVPDLITILDFETAQPISAERLRYGQRVTVLGLGCPAHYRTADALRAVGPACFGFEHEFVPIEELA